MQVMLWTPMVPIIMVQCLFRTGVLFSVIYTASDTVYHATAAAASVVLCAQVCRAPPSSHGRGNSHHRIHVCNLTTNMLSTTATASTCRLPFSSCWTQCASPRQCCASASLLRSSRASETLCCAARPPLSLQNRHVCECDWHATLIDVHACGALWHVCTA